MDSVTRNQVLQEKRVFDVLGIHYFTGTDTEVSSYVASKLTDYKANINLPTGAYQLPQVLSLSVIDSLLFGTDCFTKVSELVKTTQCVPVFNGSLAYACHITYNFDDQKQEIVRDSGVVDHYKIPKRLSSLAPIFLGHEHLHALKETNYQEYIDAQRVGDVIPLFYELVITKQNYPQIYQIWLNARMYLMADLKNQYLAARQIMKNEFKDKDLYKIIAMRTGQYLNSFYYALILYKMYLDNPELIISNVKKVLNHEMTTIELLNNLGIYGPSNKTVFEEELNSLKKSL